MRYLLLLITLSCGIESLARPKILTTFSVLENIVENLFGSNIEVINLVPGGVDPHLFEPGAKEVKLVRTAKILVANGLHFEPWLDQLVKMAKQELLIVYASKNINARKMSDGEKLKTDPHAWNSPPELISYVNVITNELVKTFPEKSDSIKKRSSIFVKKIQMINKKFQEGFSKIKSKNRVILTTHDAAGYLSSTFKIKSIAPLGLSTAEDFKTGDLVKLMKQIKAYKLKVIFTDPSHHKILTERLAKKAQLQLGPELYLDGLSPKGGPADSIEKMLAHNLTNILKSLE